MVWSSGHRQGNHQVPAGGGAEDRTGQERRQDRVQDMADHEGRPAQVGAQLNHPVQGDQGGRRQIQRHGRQHQNAAAEAQRGPR